MALKPGSWDLETRAEEPQHELDLGLHVNVNMRTCPSYR